MAPGFAYQATDVTSPWNYWTSVVTTTANTTVPVWLEWTNGTASTSQMIWSNWVSNTTSAYPPRQVTPEEAEASRLAQQRWQADQAAARKAQVAAAAKARALLRSLLDEEQEAELEKDGYFHVHTKDGVRTYRFRPGSPPIRIRGEDGSRWSYCIHPRDYGFPRDDTTAALLLMLQDDEEQFLRVANATLQGAAAA